MGIVSRIKITKFYRPVTQCPFSYDIFLLPLLGCDLITRQRKWIFQWFPEISLLKVVMDVLSYFPEIFTTSLLS